MEYRRREMKQAVRESMRQTRPRPFWMTLLYLVIVGIGTMVLQRLLGSVLTLGSLSGFDFSAAGIDWELIFTSGIDWEMLFESGFDWEAFFMSGVDWEILLASGLDLEQILFGGIGLEWVWEQLMLLLIANGPVIAAVVAGSILTGILTYLWETSMGAGYVGYTLSMSRKENPGVKRLFCGFQKFGRVILSNILVGIFTFLWSALFTLAYALVVLAAVLLMDAVSAVSILLLVLGTIGFVVVELWVVLRYAMTTYLVLDRDVSVLEAIRKSKQLMKKNKARLFVLHLSFIGWYLLEYAILLVGMALMAACITGTALGSIQILACVGLVLGIGLIVALGLFLLNLRLIPYIAGTTAKFYDYTLAQRPDLFPDRFDGTYTVSAIGNPSDPTID